MSFKFIFQITIFIFIIFITSCTQYQQSFEKGKDLYKRAEALKKEAWSIEEKDYVAAGKKFEEAKELYDEAKFFLNDAHIEDPSNPDPLLLIELVNENSIIGAYCISEQEYYIKKLKNSRNRSEEEILADKKEQEDAQKKNSNSSKPTWDSVTQKYSSTKEIIDESFFDKNPYCPKPSEK